MTIRTTFRHLSKIPKAIELIRKRPYRVSEFINRHWYNFRYSSLGDEFIREDWDNLLILDAARPDMLDAESVFPDAEITDKISLASSSPGFINKQFSERQLHDTVYVTANPHVNNLEDGVFHKVVNLLTTDWDDSLKTVPPWTVVDAALEASHDHVDKRLIVHFMQPHFPFLGQTGDRIPSGFSPSVGETQYRHPWFEQMRNQEHDHKTLVTAYEENHEIAIKNAKRLVDGLDGKTVLTADHGNLIGERGFPIPIRLYGHPKNFKHPSLLRVPWVVIDGERRKVVSDPPKERERLDDRTVKNRLSALGYTDN